MELVNITQTDYETEQEIFNTLRGTQFVALIIPFKRSMEFYRYVQSAPIDREQVVYACKLMIKKIMDEDDEMQ